MLTILYVAVILYCFALAMRGNVKPNMSVTSSGYWHPSAPE